MGRYVAYLDDKSVELRTVVSEIEAGILTGHTPSHPFTPEIDDIRNQVEDYLFRVYFDFKRVEGQPSDYKIYR